MLLRNTELCYEQDASPYPDFVFSYLSRNQDVLISREDAIAEVKLDNSVLLRCVVGTPTLG